MLTKRCAQCNAEFSKPPSCGMPEWNAKRRFCSKRCGYDALIGTVGHRKGTGKGLGSMGGKMLPCRICGNTTRYPGSEKSHLFGMVHCGSEECRAESKRRRYEKTSATALRQIANGERKVLRMNWLKANQIASEEKAIEPWMIENGFVAQYKILTGAHSFREPRYYKMDFAHVEKRVCVEIDGSSHKIKKRRIADAARDEFMAKMGWRTIRIPAALVVSDKDQVKNTVTASIL